VVDMSSPCTVEARYKARARWPARGQPPSLGSGPDWSPQKTKREHDPNILEETGTCKPGEESAASESAASDDME